MTINKFLLIHYILFAYYAIIFTPFLFGRTKHIPKFCESGLIQRHMSSHEKSMGLESFQQSLTYDVEWIKNKDFFNHLQLIDLVSQLIKPDLTFNEAEATLREKRFLHELKKTIFKIFWYQNTDKNRLNLANSACQEGFLEQVIPKDLLSKYIIREKNHPNKRTDPFNNICLIKTNSLHDFEPYLSQGVINFYLADKLLTEEDYNPNEELAILCKYWQINGYSIKGSLAPKTFQLNNSIITANYRDFEHIFKRYRKIMRGHIEDFFNGGSCQGIVENIVHKAETMASYLDSNNEKNSLKFLTQFQIQVPEFLARYFSEEMAQIIDDESQILASKISDTSLKIDIILSRRDIYIEQLKLHENSLINDIGDKLYNFKLLENSFQPFGLKLFDSQVSKKHYLNAYRYVQFFNLAKATIAMTPEVAAVKSYFNIFGKDEGLKLMPNGWKDPIWEYSQKDSENKYSLNINLFYLEHLFDESLNASVFFHLSDIDEEKIYLGSIKKDENTYYTIKPDPREKHCYKINLHERSKLGHPVTNTKYLKVLHGGRIDEDFLIFIRKIINDRKLEDKFRLLGSPNSSDLLELALLKNQRGKFRASGAKSTEIEALDIESLRYSHAPAEAHRLADEIENLSFIEEKLLGLLPLWKDRTNKWIAAINESNTSCNSKPFENFLKIWKKIEEDVQGLSKKLSKANKNQHILKSIRFKIYSELLLYVSDKNVLITCIGETGPFSLDLTSYFFSSLLNSIGHSVPYHKEILANIMDKYENSNFPQSIRPFLIATKFCETHAHYKTRKIAKKARVKVERLHYRLSGKGDLGSAPEIETKREQFRHHLENLLLTDTKDLFVKDRLKGVEFINSIDRYFYYKIRYVVLTFLEDPQFYFNFYERFSPPIDLGEDNSANTWRSRLFSDFAIMQDTAASP